MGLSYEIILMAGEINSDISKIIDLFVKANENNKADEVIALYAGIKFFPREDFSIAEKIYKKYEMQQVCKTLC